jgi:hypothetical protein
VFVEHAIGSRERPMSDGDLARKFHGLVDPVLGAEKAKRLVDLCAKAAKLDDVGVLTAAARP